MPRIAASPRGWQAPPTSRRARARSTFLSGSRRRKGCSCGCHKPPVSGLLPFTVSMSALVQLRRKKDLRAFLPTTREEMAARGWQELDVLLVTGDAYVDHPSFGMAIIGRALENAGFR